MIKRIQLRGISRTPSDRMNEDGGVAESLNTYIAEQESAPVLPPEDMTSKLGLPQGQTSSSNHRCVYIHRVGAEDHYIYVTRDFISGNRRRETLLSFPEMQEIYTTPYNVEILDKTVTSIGNTLIFSTTNGNGYAIYKNGKYSYLGSAIPQPLLAVYPKIYGGAARLSSSVYIYGPSRTSPSNNDEIWVDANLYMAKSNYWSAALNAESDSRPAAVEAVTRAIWGGMQEALLDSQYFRYPVFVRYALKLYDNSYVYHTVPAFLGGGFKRAFSSTLVYKEYEGSSSQGSGKYYATYAKIQQDSFAYKIISKILNAWAFDDWKDVVKSIDMFISEPIIYPEINSRIIECDTTETTTTSSGLTTNKMAFHFQDPVDSDEEAKSIRDVMIDGSRLFYKVRSFSIDNLQELSEGYEQKNSKQLSYIENLATRETLPDDFRSNNIYTPERNQVFNHRLISMGITETFGRGMLSLYGIIPTSAISASNPESRLGYRFIYEIKDNDGTTKYVYSAASMQTPTLDYKTIYAGLINRVPEGSTPITTYNSDVCQIIFYPDTRCVAVHVINKDGQSVRLEMKSHPYLNCAYYLGDISKKLSDLTFANATLPEENRTGSSYKYSYLFQSAMENPFYYPASGRIKFSANLITVAAISTALSEGQYGQFDLYIFTDKGIWVLNPNDEGSFLTSKPLSRDVCLSESAVVSIDQAVVFVTAKGVMLLDGTKITNLSPAMTGKHYSMEESAINVLMARDAGPKYRHALADNTPFMDYMQRTDNGEMQIAYDYTGGRLIFFNPAFNYEYIYMLQTNTWHKYVMDIQRGDEKAMNIKVLNSYPGCYLFCRDKTNKLYLYNWSTVLDVLVEDTEVTGIIASRPFDLDEPDTLKTINHIKIRGMYERYRTGEDGKKTPRVSYMLLGSQDGIHFHLLDSLRGKSWKLFRIIVLYTLNPTERISWIDIDYETRFKNKLR